MARFEIISSYRNADIALPIRATESSAGYDLAAAEDIVVPSIWNLFDDATKMLTIESDEYLTLPVMAEFTKQSKIKPTLVPTGLKCALDPNTYLQLSVRSSSPLKYWLMMANGVGIIDADYYNNEQNEGHIYVQLFNLSPYNLQIQKGDIIAQGIILPYLTTDNDAAVGERIGGFGSTSEVAQ